MWNKIKEFFKKYWGILLAIFSSIVAFIFGSNRRRNKILRDTQNRAKQSGQQFAEHRESIETARNENTKSTERIESSKRITEDIQRTNDSISGSVGEAREQLQSIESSIDARIEQLRKSKKD